MLESAFDADFLAIHLLYYLDPCKNMSLLSLQVKLRHSVRRAGQDYDFRRDGVLTPESLSVYEFEVQHNQQPQILNVLLEVTKVFNSQYPVAAVVLIW